MPGLRKTLALLLLAVMLGAAAAHAADKGTFSTAPTTNKGKKWRIGYYEGGEYLDFQKNLTAMVRELMGLGWLQKTEIPTQKGEQTKDLWAWLHTVPSEYLEFVPDAHYSDNWDDKIRKETSPKLIERLNAKKDIDVMIAMGTWAGQDLANDKHSTPTLVAGTANALSSNIIKSVEDSGFDHIQARIDPLRFERQVRLFHDIIGFKKLGIAYEDSSAGKSYAGLEQVEKVAAERTFEIVRCYTKSDVSDVAVAEASVRGCFEKLAKETQAIYVTVQGGVSQKNLPQLVKMTIDSKIPTFAQNGSDEVKAGFLLSISLAGFKYAGLFYAESLAKICNGAKPRQLEQVFEDPPKIAINLKTAELIGFDPPVDILGAADEIFDSITAPAP